jgi:predicted nucleic acid-binding protein
MKKKDEFAKVISFPKHVVKRQVDLSKFPSRIAVDACFISKVNSCNTATPEDGAYESRLVWDEWLLRGGLFIPTVVLAEFATAGHTFPTDSRFQVIPLNSPAISRIAEVVKARGPWVGKKFRNDVMIAACLAAHGITEILTYDVAAANIWSAFAVNPRNAESFLAPQLELSGL